MDGELMEIFCDEIRETIYDIGKKLLKTETENFQVLIEPLFTEGENLIGTIYRVRFNATDGDQKSSLFLKVAPNNELKRSLLQINNTFVREAYAYDVVLPYFREFQQLKGIPTAEMFTEYPICYRTITTEPTESLFFEDMNLTEFMMIDKDELTTEHILLVMKTMAKFHAISFALKDQEPEKFAELLNGLNEIFFVRGENSVFADQINYAQTIAFNCITDESDTHLIKALMRLYQTNQYDLIAELVDGNEGEPYSVVLHGDMWSNNTMFKYDETNKQLQSVCFIDWQVMRYSSPVLDLMYFIFSCTTRELRGRNYNVYLKTYHDCLTQFIKRLGSNPENLYPFGAFQKQLQKFGKFGMLNATFLLPVHMREIDLEDPTGGTELSAALKKRFRDIAADSYRLGYI